MNAQEARIIDPLLTNIALGYQPENLIYTSLFPEVPVDRRGGKVVQWGKDVLEYTDTSRAIGADVLQESYGYGSQSYSLIEHNLDAKTPVELVGEAKEPNIKLIESSLMIVKKKMGNEKEILSAGIALNPANYSASNKVAYTAGNGWGGSANPITDGETAIGVIEEATGGMCPNTVVISRNTLRALRQNTYVLAQVEYTGKAPTSANVTLGMLAEMWGVDKVVVGKHTYWNGSAMVSTWSDDAVFAFTERGSMSNLMPSYGYTYQLKGHPYVSKGWWENKNRSFINGYNDSYQQVITMADSGYLITGAAL